MSNQSVERFWIEEDFESDKFCLQDRENYGKMLKQGNYISTFYDNVDDYLLYKYFQVHTSDPLEGKGDYF